MNPRTTLLLALVLAGLTVLYLWRPRQDLTDASPSGLATVDSTDVSRKLIEPPIDEVTRVACRKPSGEAWVFEKRAAEPPATGTDEWRLIEPSDMPVIRWEVDRIARTISDLHYQVSYVAGAAGAPTLEEAGLQPPQWIVTVSGKNGASTSVELGHAASTSESYARLQGRDEFVVATTSLTKLIKPRLLDYRDRQLWNFTPQDATHLEIVDRDADGGEATYRFIREGGGWKLTAPAQAPATSKVDSCLQALSRLRATKWVDDRPERLSAYGLEPATLTVRVSVDVEVPIEKDQATPDVQKDEEAGEGEKAEDTPESPTSRTETRTYLLHVADRSPIDEQTSAFIRVGDEAVVGTLPKTTVDQLRPVMAEWRDMRLTTANVDAATRIELRTPEVAAVLVRNGTQWSFESDAALAEGSAVEDLLRAVRELRAVAFVDDGAVTAAVAGLEIPRATVEFTVPDVAQPVLLSVGAETDAATRLLTYVRAGKEGPLAKVRSTELAPLLREPREYRDRTILDAPAAQLVEIALDRDNPANGQWESIVLRRRDGAWTMTAPVEATVRADHVDALATMLAEFRGDRVVDEQGSPSAFGLDAPAVVVSVTHQPPTEYRLEPAPEKPADSEEKTPEAEEGGDAAAAQLVPVPVEPPSVRQQVLLTEHDGRHYAKRVDGPAIFAVSADGYAKLLAEFRSDAILRFEAADVQAFSVRNGTVTHAFERQDGKWIYASEPDLPIDTTKVENLLLRIRDIKSERFYQHVSPDLAALGLLEPAHEVRITRRNAPELRLIVSSQTCTKGPQPGAYAAVDDLPGVFLLRAEDATRFAVSLEELASTP